MHPRGVAFAACAASVPNRGAYCRVAIKAYFDEHGLVRQQLDSFDEFITSTIADVVEDTPTIHVRPTPQYGPGQITSTQRYEVKFGQVKFTYPSQKEADTNKAEPLFPHEARLRNLTYETALVIDVTKTAYSTVTKEQEGPEQTTTEWFGNIPVMVRSGYCRLKHMTDMDRARHGECVFDQVRPLPLVAACPSCTLGEPLLWPYPCQ